MQIFNHGITAAALFYFVGYSSNDAACAVSMISED
jgi:NADH:ubiquinone oxidoreductase subunit 4 (subunit M)